MSDKLAVFEINLVFPCTRPYSLGVHFLLWDILFLYDTYKIWLHPITKSCTFGAGCTVNCRHCFDSYYPVKLSYM